MSDRLSAEPLPAVRHKPNLSPVISPIPSLAHVDLGYLSFPETRKSPLTTDDDFPETTVRSLFKVPEFKGLLVGNVLMICTIMAPRVFMPAIGARFFGHCSDKQKADGDEDCKYAYVEWGLWYSLSISMWYLLSSVTSGGAGRFGDNYGRTTLIAMQLFIGTLPWLPLLAGRSTMIIFLVLYPMGGLLGRNVIGFQAAISDLFEEESRTLAYSISGAMTTMGIFLAAGFALALTAFKNSQITIAGFVVLCVVATLYTGILMPETLQNDDFDVDFKHKFKEDDSEEEFVVKRPPKRVAQRHSTDISDMPSATGVFNAADTRMAGGKRASDGEPVNDSKHLSDGGDKSKRVSDGGKQRTSAKLPPLSAQPSGKRTSGSKLPTLGPQTSASVSKRSSFSKRLSGSKRRSGSGRRVSETAQVKASLATAKRGSSASVARESLSTLNIEELSEMSASERYLFCGEWRAMYNVDGLMFWICRVEALLYFVCSGISYTFVPYMLHLMNVSETHKANRLAFLFVVSMAISGIVGTAMLVPFLQKKFGVSDIFLCIYGLYMLCACSLFTAMIAPKGPQQLPLMLMACVTFGQQLVARIGIARVTTDVVTADMQASAFGVSSAWVSMACVLAPASFGLILAMTAKLHMAWLMPLVALLLTVLNLYMVHFKLKPGIEKHRKIIAEGLEQLKSTSRLPVISEVASDTPGKLNLV